MHLSPIQSILSLYVDLPLANLSWLLIEYSWWEKAVWPKDRALAPQQTCENGQHSRHQLRLDNRQLKTQSSTIQRIRNKTNWCKWWNEMLPAFKLYMTNPRKLGLINDINIWKWMKKIWMQTMLILLLPFILLLFWVRNSNMFVITVIPFLLLIIVIDVRAEPQSRAKLVALIVGVRQWRWKLITKIIFVTTAA